MCIAYTRAQSDRGRAINGRRSSRRPTQPAGSLLRCDGHIPSHVTGQAPRHRVCTETGSASHHHHHHHHQSPTGRAGWMGWDASTSNGSRSGHAMLHPGLACLFHLHGVRPPGTKQPRGEKGARQSLGQGLPAAARTRGHTSQGCGHLPPGCCETIRFRRRARSHAGRLPVPGIRLQAIRQLCSKRYVFVLPKTLTKNRNGLSLQP